jgi:hypothetical protein
MLHNIERHIKSKDSDDANLVEIINECIDAINNLNEVVEQISKNLIAVSNRFTIYK